MAMTDAQLRALADTWLAISDEIGKQGVLALALCDPMEEITSRIGQMASLKFCAEALLKCLEKREEKKPMAFKHDPGLLDKIGDEEPIFILRSQDITAPGKVAEWADYAASVGSPAEKVEGARLTAKAMKEWQQNFPERVKIPD